MNRLLMPKLLAMVALGLLMRLHPHAGKHIAQAKQVTVRTLDGDTFALDLDPRESTVANLKDRIAEREGRPRDSMHLIFGGKELSEDGGRLSEHGLEVGSTVTLVLLDTTPRVHVKTKPEGKIIEIEMELTETAGSLKDKISELEGWPRERQKLSFNGRTLDDERSLADEGIDETSLVILSEMTQTIYVDSPGLGRSAFEFLPNATLRDLRSRIYREDPQWAAGPRVIFGDKQLCDDSRLLSDYGLRDQSVVRVFWALGGFFAEPLHVATPDGKKLTIMIHPDDSVASLKERIRVALGVAPDQQNLTFERKELHDDLAKLSDFGIGKDSTLNLTTKRTREFSSEWAGSGNKR